MSVIFIVIRDLSDRSITLYGAALAGNAALIPAYKKEFLK
jgi:hypothetical protein